MKNIALLSVAAGLVLFVWGFLSHAVLSWQDAVWHEFTDETVVSRALTDNSPRRGVYYLPYADDDPGPDRVRAFVNVLPPGTELSIGRQVVFGLVIQILSAFLVLGLLSRTRDSSFWGRVGFFSGVGLTIGFVSHAYYWNWFGFPTPYVVVTILDSVVGWTLAGWAVAVLARTNAFGRRDAGVSGALQEHLRGPS